MISGIRISLLKRTQTGVDDFGRPIYTETETPVDDALVGEPKAEDIPTGLDLTGRKATYWLAIPKTDTNDWECCRVRLPEPFAGTYQAVTIPIAGIPENVPLRWNKKILIERCG